MSINVVSRGMKNDGSADIVPLLLTLVAEDRSIYFPSGTYLWNSNSYTLPDHVRFLGDGIDCTNWFMGPSVPYQLVTFGGIGDISHLTIDGNSTLTGNTSPLISCGKNTLIDRVKIRNYRAMAIDAGCGDVHVDRCIINGNINHSTYGVWWSNDTAQWVKVTDSEISNNSLNAIFGGAGIVTGNKISNNADINNPGGQVAIGNAAQRSIIAHNIIQPGNSYRASGIECNGNTDIIGNQIDGCGAYGIVLQAGGKMRVSGGQVMNCGIDGILVNPGICNWSVIGVRATDEQAPKTQKYGLRILPGASDYFSVMGNDFSGNAIGGWIDGSTGSHKFIGWGNHV